MQCIAPQPSVCLSVTCLLRSPTRKVYRKLKIDEKVVARVTQNVYEAVLNSMAEAQVSRHITLLRHEMCHNFRVEILSGAL